jgi:hypothetical protein
VQQELLDELSAGTDRIEQIHWERAAQLVHASLPEL